MKRTFRMAIFEATLATGFEAYLPTPTQIKRLDSVLYSGFDCPAMNVSSKPRIAAARLMMHATSIAVTAHARMLTVWWIIATGHCSDLLYQAYLLQFASTAAYDPTQAPTNYSEEVRHLLHTYGLTNYTDTATLPQKKLTWTTMIRKIITEAALQRDIAELQENHLLYHSAFGFAVVSRIGEASVQVEWENPDEN
ncbi:MAG: hypothetical protein GY826_03585, partial [Fuerstiella sp.]|nr:hypothetical protein [Fuerstiella sp.]